MDFLLVVSGNTSKRGPAPGRANARIADTVPAHGLSACVVAKGVENQPHLAALRKLGCVTAQGDLLGCPQPQNNPAPSHNGDQNPGYSRMNGLTPNGSTRIRPLPSAGIRRRGTNEQAGRL